MTEKQSNLSLHISRYGLPVIIMFFYLSSIVHFTYTPESTFLSLRSALFMTSLNGSPEKVLASDTSASPLWSFLIIAATRCDVDTLLAAKVLSLLFACVSILIFFLVAHEVIQDRLVTFMITTAFASQGWLIQVAPSGSPFLFGFALSLAGMFFMLRNEYLLSACLISLATLVFWQAIGLMLLLLVDVYLNSFDARRGRKIGIAALLIFCGTMIPWLIFSAWSGFYLMPAIQSVEAFSETRPFEYGILSLLMCLALAGVVILGRSGKEGGAKLTALIAPFGVGIWFSIMAGVSSVNSLFFAVPCILILAFLGLRVLVQLVDERWAYPGMLALACLLVISFQIGYSVQAKEDIDDTIGRSEELSTIGYWLRSHVRRDEVIFAEEPATLAYYADHPVRSLKLNGIGAIQQVTYVVTSRDPGEYFEKAYDPTPSLSGGAGTITNRYAVWRRR